MAENLPCNPGDLGLIPGWGAKISHAATKIPHATETPGSQINQSVFFKKELGKKSPRWGGFHHWSQHLDQPHHLLQREKGSVPPGPGSPRTPLLLGVPPPR